MTMACIFEAGKSQHLFQSPGGSEMSKQEQDSSRREKLKMSLSFMLRRRVLAGIAAILIGTSLIFSGNVSAHNIDLKKARELARERARRVRDESGGKYLHYSTSCVKSYPGHNHYVRCRIDYQNEADAEKGVYTCRETIDVFMSAHDGGISGAGNWTLYTRVVSNNMCGSAD